MIDREAMELAGLHALDWLNADEEREFVRECRLNPECRRAAADMRDLVALVAAASTPPAVSPPSALAGIYARIAGIRPLTPADDKPRHVPRRSPASWLPWAVAAGFAVLAGWQAWTRGPWGEGRSTDSSAASHTGSPAPPADGGGSGHSGARGSEAARESSIGPGKLRVPSGYFTNRTHGPSGRLIPVPLRPGEARPQRAANRSGEPLPPGVADLRVVEMRPPGMMAAPEKQELLPARMAAAIAAGLDPSTPAADPSAPASPDSPATQTPVEIGVDGSPGSPDFIIKDAQVPDLHSFNLPEGSQVRHSNFPPESEYENLGFIKLSDGTVYDSRRGGLWYLSENGTERIGVLAPDSWSPPDPGDAPTAPPPGLNPGQSPTNEPHPGDSGSGSSPGDQDRPPTTVPYALPIVDHEGRGTLVVQNLPTAPDGHLYHLWMVDSQTSTPVNLGALKSETGAGAYGFELPSPEFIPSRYLMTLEKEGPVEAPGSTVVLQGP